MIEVRVTMKVTHEPLKHTPVVLKLDADNLETPPVLTDRGGVARFDMPPASGRILVSGLQRYDGRLEGEIPIELWSITESDQDIRGLSSGLPAGSNAYPNMATRFVQVGEDSILTDSEGYLVDPAEWSEDFARVLAREEGLVLTSEHWEVIRYLRAHFMRHGTQATVRDMIVHFRQVWGRERGSNLYLHKIFPRGGPQKQGNRLAGLLRIKGEH